MKILFIADLFNNELNGGAENNDNVLIDFLKNKNYLIDCIKCSFFSEEIANKYNFFIISNFITLQEKHKIFLRDKKYIIYEHDHKYIKTRDPSQYSNFKIPDDDLINVDFYKKATAVVVLSKICKEVIEKNLDLENVYNIGCSLWSDERLDFIDSLSNNKKNNKYAVLASNNPIKNTNAAIELCKKHNLDFELIPSCGELELLKRLSFFEGLVFLPGVLETFSRISAEAKMFNCKLVTKPRMLGFASEEEIYNLSGIDLINNIRNRKDAALELFNNLLTR